MDVDQVAPMSAEDCSREQADCLALAEKGCSGSLVPARVGHFEVDLADVDLADVDLAEVVLVEVDFVAVDRAGSFVVAPDLWQERSSQEPVVAHSLAQSDVFE